MILEEAKENLNNVCVRLNAKLKIHMGYKIKMLLCLYTTKK